MSRLAIRVRSREEERVPKSSQSNDGKAILTFSLPAGIIGGLCCFTPVVLTLFGVTTIAVAADFGNVLYSDYRWAFRLDVGLDFQLLHPVEMLKGVRPYVLDAGERFDPEDVGAGVQSALAVAIAKAYAEIVKQPLILTIEEPELYLHPHGCRHFYRLLRELSQGDLQIIYSTHERAFVSGGRVPRDSYSPQGASGDRCQIGKYLRYRRQRKIAYASRPSSTKE